jgi:hypothetical protein
MLQFMRTTLTLDPDIMETARALASQRGVSIGAVISDLARQGLRGGSAPERASRNGIPLLPVGNDSRVVTPELVASILDEE